MWNIENSTLETPLGTIDITVVYWEPYPVLTGSIEYQLGPADQNSINCPVLSRPILLVCHQRDIEVAPFLYCRLTLHFKD